MLPFVITVGADQSPRVCLCFMDAFNYSAWAHHHLVSLMQTSPDTLGFGSRSLAPLPATLFHLFWFTSLILCRLRPGEPSWPSAHSMGPSVPTPSHGTIICPLHSTAVMSLSEHVASVRLCSGCASSIDTRASLCFVPDIQWGAGP